MPSYHPPSPPPSPPGSSPRSRRENRSGSQPTTPPVRVVIRPTLNNLFLTILSQKGAVLRWSSSGSVGNKGPRRSTPLAAEQTAQEAALWLFKKRVRSAWVRIVGPFGARSRSAIKGLFRTGRLRLRRLQIVPPIAHNGLRRKKQRRILFFLSVLPPRLDLSSSSTQLPT